MQGKSGDCIMQKFDLIVIGGGSGGVRAARYAAGKGKKVAIFEERELGGTCVVRGCVPKKIFKYASSFSKDINFAKSFGWDFAEKTNFNLDYFMDRKGEYIKKLVGIYQTNLEKAGVTIIKEKAVFKNHNTVIGGGNDYTAENIIIAVGSKPSIPPVEGKDHMITSNEFLFNREKYKKVIVLGGGYIGLEFASILNNLESKVMVVDLEDNILRGFDKSIVAKMTSIFKNKGIVIKNSTTITKISKVSNTLIAEIGGDKIEVDAIVSSAGRKPNVEGLGLENVGLELSQNGSIKVDSNFETSQKGIFAIGDVVDKINLTPIAIRQAMNVVDFICGEEVQKFDYVNVPTAVFTSPTIATVGLSEEEARKNYEIEVYESEYFALKHALMAMEDKEKEYMKLIVDKKTDKILGLHIIAEGADEMIQGFAVCISAGLTKKHLDNMVGVHPSSVEELFTLKK